MLYLRFWKSAIARRSHQRTLSLHCSAEFLKDKFFGLRGLRKSNDRLLIYPSVLSKHLELQDALSSARATQSKVKPCFSERTYMVIVWICEAKRITPAARSQLRSQLVHLWTGLSSCRDLQCQSHLMCVLIQNDV